MKTVTLWSTSEPLLEATALALVERGLGVRIAGTVRRLDVLEVPGVAAAAAEAPAVALATRADRADVGLSQPVAVFAPSGILLGADRGRDFGLRERCEAARAATGRLRWVSVADYARQVAERLAASDATVGVHAVESGVALGLDDAALAAALADALARFTPPGMGEVTAGQWLPRPVSEAFPFFSSPENLEAITPPTLRFKVLRSSTPAIGEGTLIDYVLRVHGVPMRWRTRIEEWKPGRSFVDTQLKGPYRVWHHTHSFQEVAGGTWMTDRVLYELPLGALGRLVAGRFVAKDVGQIFAFRRKALASLFSAGAPRTPPPRGR